MGAIYVEQVCCRSNLGGTDAAILQRAEANGNPVRLAALEHGNGNPVLFKNLDPFVGAFWISAVTQEVARAD